MSNRAVLQRDHQMASDSEKGKKICPSEVALSCEYDPL